VLALELEWKLDLRRLDGVHLPSHEQLVVRTAQPTQDIAHLRRLVGEHLSRSTLAAPASELRLRSLETMPWGGANKSLLPEENTPGEFCSLQFWETGSSGGIAAGGPGVLQEHV